MAELKQQADAVPAGSTAAASSGATTPAERVVDQAAAVNNVATPQRSRVRDGTVLSGGWTPEVFEALSEQRKQEGEQENIIRALISNESLMRDLRARAPRVVAGGQKGNMAALKWAFSAGLIEDLHRFSIGKLWVSRFVEFLAQLLMERPATELLRFDKVMEAWNFSERFVRTHRRASKRRAKAQRAVIPKVMNAPRREEPEGATRFKAVPQDGQSRARARRAFVDPRLLALDMSSLGWGKEAKPAVDYSTVQDYLNGTTRRLQTHTRVRLAKALGIAETDLPE